MPNKRGKFGIKFWVLADASCPYVLNIRAYFGKHSDEDRQGLQLGEYVVLKLTEPFVNKGYNVTTDIFTSLKLADKLSKKKTTLVGTVRGNRHELPPEFNSECRNVHSMLQGYCEAHQAVFVSYHPKKRKILKLLSTMQSLEAGDLQNGTFKPAVVTFYNSTKGGVDTVEVMCWVYSA